MPRARAARRRRPRGWHQWRKSVSMDKVKDFAPSMKRRVRIEIVKVDGLFR